MLNNMLGISNSNNSEIDADQAALWSGHLTDEFARDRSVDKNESYKLQT